MVITGSKERGKLPLYERTRVDMNNRKNLTALTMKEHPVYLGVKVYRIKKSR